MAANPRCLVEAHALSDVGLVRASNEDSFLVANLSEGLRLERNGALTFESGPLGALFAVADGMGGVAGGEMASRLGVQTLYREVQDTIQDIDQPDEESVEQILIEAVGIANRRIHEMSNRHQTLEGMGTTLTIAFELHARLLIGQIGDSRAYLIREDGIWQLTRDQSLVARKVSAGELTEQQARRHPDRNILLQALGSRPMVELALRRLNLEPGDVVLLCSDGLHSQLTDAELYDGVFGSPSLKDACIELINLANQRGGPDNITVILTRFQD
jgi:serine/threonine protein phosphatase PrpC